MYIMLSKVGVKSAWSTLAPMICLALWTAIAAAAPLLPNDFFALAPTYDPVGPATVDTDAGTITDGGSLVFVGAYDPGSQSYVFTFGDVVIDEVVTAVGSRGFAILSHRDLHLTGAGRLNASAPAAPYALYAFDASPGGPGGAPGGVCGPGGDPGGGGATGLRGGGGGHGGAGGDGGAAVGGAAHGDLSVVMSGGGGGGMGTRLDYYTGTYCIAPPGAGGGGAVELTARGVLTLDGVVSARGGDAGGGGGAGGGVLVSGHGGSTCAGTLDASGGSSSSNSGGGGGGRVLLVGVDGSTCAVAVPGGGTAGGQGGGSGTWSALDPDDDGDGWTRIAGHDCDDLDSAIHPGAAELAGDGVDQDCDGSDGAAVDADGDGYPAPFDCDDTDVRLYPGAVEVVGDGLDQDCDGAESCYVDADDDGARSVSVVISIDVDCADPFEGVAPDPLDCNDTDPNVRPAAADLPCDGIDQDCDSLDLCEQHTGDTGDTGSTGSHTGAHTGVAAHTGRAIPHSGTAGGDTGHTGLEPSTGTDGPPTPESPRPGEFHAAGCASTGPAGSVGWWWVAVALATRRARR
jgi:hypothetical protein